MENQDKSDSQILGYLVKNGELALEIGRKFIFQDFGISEPKYEILCLLSRMPTLRLSELSDAMRVSNANITGLVRRMEKDGLLSRAKDPEDGRATLVCLTPKGKNLHQKVHPCYENALVQIFQKIPEEDKNHMLATLEKINNYMLKISSQAFETSK